MLLAALIAVWSTRKGRMPALPAWIGGAFVLALILPYVANSAGWLMTEMGRQPWVVFGLLKTEQGVSLATSASEVWITLVGFTAIYGVLMLVDIYLLRKYSAMGPSIEASH